MIGGSYIACEVAASLTELGSSCSLVMLESVLLSRRFGEQAGRSSKTAWPSTGSRPSARTSSTGSRARGRVSRVVTKCGRQLDADAVVIGIGAVPDVMTGAHRRPGARRRRRRRRRLPPPDGGARRSSPRATSPSTRASCMAANGSGSSTGTWPSTRARRRRSTCSAATSHTTSCPTSSPTCRTGLRSNTSARPTSGTRRSSAARSTRASSRSSICKAVVLKAALSVGRSDDLEHARRLLIAGTDVTQPWRRRRLGDASISETGSPAWAVDLSRGLRSCRARTRTLNSRARTWRVADYSTRQ